MRANGQLLRGNEVNGHSRSTESTHIVREVLKKKREKSIRSFLSTLI